MTPIPTVWWLRPDNRAARVGAHSAVVWKRLYFKPFAASRSAVGVAQGPPNALEAAKPTSSSRMTSTFGAPAGGRSGSIAGNAASAALASTGSVPSNGLSGIGKSSRGVSSVILSSSSPWASALALVASRRGVRHCAKLALRPATGRALSAAPSYSDSPQDGDPMLPGREAPPVESAADKLRRGGTIQLG